MKKTIAYIVITAALIVAAFFVGKNQGTTQTIVEKHNADLWYIDYSTCPNEVVVDWNTNGNELSMTLSDGVEIYATKSESVYTERKQYVSFDEIANVSKADGIITIYTKDGNVYEIAEEKGE